MNRRAAPLLLMLLLGCSVKPTKESPAVSETQVPGSKAPSPPPIAALPPGTQVRITKLVNCPIVQQSLEEMPYTEVQCVGPAGWSLRISDSDARQTMTVIAPDGSATRLDTARLGGGGFSSFGNMADWSGPVTNDGFQPQSLLVNLKVAERPFPAPETPYYLGIRLVPTPCIVAVLSEVHGRRHTEAWLASVRERECID